MQIGYVAGVAAFGDGVCAILANGRVFQLVSMGDDTPGVRLNDDSEPVMDSWGWVELPEVPGTPADSVRQLARLNAENRETNAALADGRPE